MFNSLGLIYLKKNIFIFNKFSVQTDKQPEKYNISKNLFC
jgi:hypothetical protein